MSLYKLGSKFILANWRFEVHCKEEALKAAGEAAVAANLVFFFSCATQQLKHTGDSPCTSFFYNAKVLHVLCKIHGIFIKIVHVQSLPISILFIVPRNYIISTFHLSCITMILVCFMPAKQHFLSKAGMPTVSSFRCFYICFMCEPDVLA